MAMLDLITVALQIILPLVLIASVVLLAGKSGLELAVCVFGAGSALLALLLVAVWMVPPWWVPYVYLGLLIVTVARVIRRKGIPARWWPQNWRGWVLPSLFFLLGIWGAAMTTDALKGRQAPPGSDVLDLAFPLGPGNYLVASGGASESINGHFLTLNPRTDRQRAYRGQSYAVDLIEVDSWGLRATGWRPSDPTAYLIFGKPVFAPCDGEVLRMYDGMPDMEVPVTDTSRLEGNHVVLKCGNKAILVAHLRQGSVRVAQGARVRTGEQVGEVGNSGQSTEPHLHIHAQELPESGPLLSGDPVYLRLDGRFPVRNARLEYPEP
ncbi:M23 family metallopeptidase [Qipengyuania aurantiaca]|uniref:M23 family metallopeptidase n=1 Tax=Qipengyuania aurantiaca TaxID=2867233 RepID=A0ABX8ZSD3_9SPHN|nr:M23 family metallopeptidase [Qipengyuania aurantiaca]QZD90523.1 M23 family metallopeptidase [Qipengyuania aurantiaca]